MTYLPKDAGVNADLPESADDHPALDHAYAVARQEVIGYVTKTPFDLGDESVAPDLPLLLDEYETAIALWFTTQGSDKQHQFIKDAAERARKFLKDVANGYSSVVGLTAGSGGGSAGSPTYIASTDAGTRYFDTSSNLSAIRRREPGF